MVERTSRLAMLLCLSLFAAPAWAAETAPPDARALIERQLDAFARDDAEGAYALAAPGIQAIFTDSGSFLAMVREKYAPVYRHHSVEFGSFAEDGDKIEQALTIVDVADQWLPPDQVDREQSLSLARLERATRQHYRVNPGRK
jgi:hypothetical protein